MYPTFHAPVRLAAQRTAAAEKLARLAFDQKKAERFKRLGERDRTRLEASQAAAKTNDVDKFFRTVNHDCNVYAVTLSEGPSGQGWECDLCGTFLGSDG